jgi:hypothetical protein
MKGVSTKLTTEECGTAIEFWTCILDVPDSNLGKFTGYLVTEDFRYFPQSLSALK